MELAEKLFGDALAHFSKAGKSMALIYFLGSYLHFITDHFRNTGDLPRLHRFHLEVIEEICGKRCHTHSTALNSFGLYYLNVEFDFEQAISLFHDAIEFSQPHQAPQVYMNLVNAYQRQKDFNSAMKFAKKGMKIAQEYKSNIVKSLKYNYDKMRRKPQRVLLLKQVDEFVKQEKDEMKKRPKLSKEARKMLKHMLLQRRCAHCGACTETLKACAKCKAAFYCSRDHQREHWRIHKTECGSNDN